jgi:arylsulfatase A-like enzyme
VHVKRIMVVLLLLVTACSSGSKTSSHTRARSPAPNIVWFMTDDMRWDEFDPLPEMKPGGGYDWVQQHGVRFPTEWLSNNLCCPARATAVTGQTSFNNGVYTNQQYADFQDSLPLWLQKAGYCTGMTGKYLNGYNLKRRRPAGWDYWEPFLSHIDDETGYAIEGRDGKARTPHRFITDEVAAITRAQLRDCLATGKPTFVALWPFAPHFGSDPAPKYADATVPPWTNTDPSYEEQDISDKPQWLQTWHPKVPFGIDRAFVDSHDKRMRTLLSADDALKSVIEFLRNKDELDNTIIIVTSDNGWFLGEHRISERKRMAYEAGQVALWIAGPGFPKHETRNAFVTNLDVPATIVAATGAKPLRTIDGRSVQDILKDHGLAHDRFLPLFVPTEPGDETHQPPGQGVRTAHYKYLKYDDGSEELYDLRTDPHELTNLAADPAHADLKRQMIALAKRAKECKGDACRASAPAALQ